MSRQSLFKCLSFLSAPARLGLALALLVTMLSLSRPAPTLAQWDGGVGTGPGGVGSTDGSGNLEAWYRADKGVYTDSGCMTAASNTDAVGCWADQSGNNNHATQGTGGAQPVYATNALNSQPVLQFDGGGDVLNLPDGTVPIGNSPYSVFSVVNADVLGNRGFLGSGNYLNVNQVNAFRFSDSGHLVNYWWGNDLTTASSTVSVGTNYALSFVYDTSTGRTARVNGTIPTNGTQLSTTRNGGAANNTIGRTWPGASEFWDGTIVETIIYADTLNDAERILVENYLSAKYAIPLSSNDRYVGDTAGVDYDLDVAGIGQQNGSNTEAHSAGLIARDVEGNYLNENGDYVLFGHAQPTNGTTTADLGSGAASGRWTRVWYVDFTDPSNNRTSADVIFDFSEGGIGAMPSSNPIDYWFLFRPGTSGDFVHFAQASSVSGDQVIFDNLNLVGATDGYITLGWATPRISVDGLNTGDWGTIAPSITDPAGDETTLPTPNLGQDITAVYLAHSDTAAYFRFDTVGTPAQTSIDFYVDHDGSGTCPEQAGHGSGNRYDWHLEAYYSGGMWQTQSRSCTGSTWGSFATNGIIAVADIVEIAVPYGGDPGTVYFFVRYGTSTDYAPNAGSDPATLIDLASLSATAGEDGVLVAWTTASEIDNAGFNVYRADSDDGAYVKLNDGLIAAQGGPTQGASYSFLDEGASGGYYKLEDVDTGGASTFHGPVSAEGGDPTSVGLLSFATSTPVALLVIPLLAFGASGLALLRRRRRL